MNRLSIAAIFIGSCLCFSLSANAQSPKLCSRHFRILSATKEAWSPGIVRNNNEIAGGVNYELKIKVRRKAPLEFQNLTAENKTLKIEVRKGGEPLTASTKKGDVLTLIARYDLKKESSDNQTSDISKTINENNTAAAIHYIVNDVHYLHLVESIETKAMTTPPKNKR